MIRINLQLQIQTHHLPYIEIGASSGVQSVRPVTRRAGKGILDAIMDGSEAHSSFCWEWLLTNWWAVFILIPAGWAYVGAWDIYQDNGHFTRGGASSLTVGILLTLLAFVFLLNIAVNLFWPVLLIAGGVALLLTGLLRT